MAVTHKNVNLNFFRGLGVLEIAAKCRVPVTTVENAIRQQLRKDVFVAPVQEHLFAGAAPRQMTISEVYGEIEIQ